MNRYFWVKWSDSKNCEYVVAILCFVNSMYYFRYNPELYIDNNIPLGFNGVPSFGKICGLSSKAQKDKIFGIYSSPKLFDFFKMRIISGKQLYLLKTYGLTNYNECDLLSLTSARIPTDSFFVEEMDVNAINEVQQLLENN